MEENVALDSTKQRKFAKSIKGIKKLLKKNESKPHKPAVLAPKDTEDKVDKKKRKRKERGLVYLSHIPHGFYEHEMTQYFKQFGMVTNVRVIRSPKTGRSKGFAFVEFREPAVAEIVAETMNNYLMGKRLIKAAIIPPEKQKRRAMRKHWTTLNNPTAENRMKMKKAFNSNKDEAGNLATAKKLLKSFEKKKKKLSALGINVDFVTPVDVPEALKEQVQGTKEASVKTIEVKVEDVKQKKSKSKIAEPGEKLSTKEKKKETKQPKPTEIKAKKEVAKTVESDKIHKAQKKMKDAGVKPLENFIKIQEESGDESDCSVEFDSDEYEKMLENDSGDSSDGSEDEDGDEEGEDDNDENSEEDLPPLIPIKAKKGKKPVVAVVAAPPKSKKGTKPINVQKPQNKTQIQQQKKPQQQAPKRKNPQPEMSPKKPKFEKQDKKQRNKQFKKKNKAH